MIQKLNYTKIITILLFFGLFFLLFAKCEDNLNLANVVKKQAKNNEANAELFEKRNINLINQKRNLQDSIYNLLKNSKVIEKKIIEVRTKVVYIKDTSTAKRYITERYGDSAINLVNDLKKGDVCKNEVKLLRLHIENKDSILTFKDKIISFDSIVINNKDNALKELKSANELNKELFENSQKQLIKKKRENIFVKIGIFALGILAIVK